MEQKTFWPDDFPAILRKNMVLVFSDIRPAKCRRKLRKTLEFVAPRVMTTDAQIIAQILDRINLGDPSWVSITETAKTWYAGISREQLVEVFPEGLRSPAAVFCRAVAECGLTHPTISAGKSLIHTLNS